MRLDGLIQQIVSGLNHESITSCSDYAQQYRMMGPPYPGPWSFTHHPWLREMMDCKADVMVGRKSAQAGFTEVAINKSFYAIDILKWSVLYVLPNTRPAATNFSASRFDPALEMSPHLRNIFNDTRNVNHKRAGNASLFIRGSRSKTDLKSDPAALMIFDELEEMVQENIPLATERMSGQLEHQQYKLSTPSIEDFGIDKYFQKTDQRHFFFRCPHCSKLTELIFPDCLIVAGDNPDDPEIMKSHIICKECKQKLEHDQKQYFLADGVWVPQYENRMDVGYYVNQLYSSTAKPYELAQHTLNAEYNPAIEQELYNSKMGLPHTVKGAQVSESDIIECMGDYKMQSTAEQTHVITMGVDVGKHLHVEIDKWRMPDSTNYMNLHEKAVPYAIKIVKVEHFEELLDLIKQYNVHECVIDANPERRMVRKLIARCSNVSMCFFGNNANGKTIYKTDTEESAVTIDRTTWLDIALSRFRTKTIKLAYDTPEEYKKHVRVPVRVYKTDNDGNAVAKYISGEKADHYAFARLYSEVALSKYWERGENKDI